MNQIWHYFPHNIHQWSLC